MVKSFITNNKVIKNSRKNEKKGIISKVTNMFSSFFFKKKKKENYSELKNLIVCPICHKVIVEPRLTKCGHIFCGLCIYEYLFLFDKCIKCKQYINPLSLWLKFNNLNNIISNFIENSTKLIKNDFKKRKKEYEAYMKKKNHLKFEKLEIIDILTLDNVWAQGIIIKIYKINQKVDSIKVNMLNQNQYSSIFKIDSYRLAKKGFYTNRTDLPKIKYLKNGNKKIFLNDLPFTFKNNKEYIKIDQDNKLYF